MQIEIDAKARLFNVFQLEGERKPDIKLMPDTSIKTLEWDKIGEIMKYILSGTADDDESSSEEDIWAFYFSDFQDRMFTSQVYAVQLMENQLYGSE